MGERLLVPLDGSARAATVLFALDLWAPPSAEVLLLRVPPQPRRQRRDGPHVQTVAEQCRAAEVLACNYLDAVAIPLQRRGWQIRRLVRLGEPAAEILAAAEAEGVRAILLASRIPCGLGAPWQARVLQRLIARARVPVVVFYPGLGVQLAAQVADR